MTPIEKAAIMAFGAVLAIVGVVLFAKAKGAANGGTNKIKFARLELEFGAPSLFIFVIGCGLFVFPFFVGDSTSLVTDAPIASSTTGSALSENITPAAVSPDGTHERQLELERKVEELQRKLDAGTGVITAQPADAGFPPRNIAGQWYSASGSTYLVQQQGERVAIQEFTQGMVSAVGEGTFNGEELAASFQTLVGEVDVVLNLSSDRTRFSGQLTHTLTGGVTAFEMRR